MRHDEKPKDGPASIETPCILCGRPGYPTKYLVMDIDTVIHEIPTFLCHSHKACWYSHGNRKLDRILLIHPNHQEMKEKAQSEFALKEQVKE